MRLIPLTQYDKQTFSHTVTVLHASWRQDVEMNGLERDGPIVWRVTDVVCRCPSAVYVQVYTTFLSYLTKNCLTHG